MKNHFLKSILYVSFQTIVLTCFAQQLEFKPLNIYPNSTGPTELAGKMGEKFMTIQYSNVSDTVSFVWLDPNTGAVQKKSIVQPEINGASHVGYFIKGDSCFLVTQNIQGPIIRIGIFGIDKLGQVFRTYTVLDEFNTGEKKPSVFTFQYFKDENAVLLSKWKLVPGTNKLGNLRIINSKGELASKQQIQTGYLDERINLDLFLYKGEAYAAMQQINAELSFIPSTVLYKSGAGAFNDPIRIQQPDFYFENLIFSKNAVTGDLYLGGLSFNAENKKNCGLALLRINGLKATDQFKVKVFEQELYQSLYPTKKQRKKIFEEELSLEKFEFTDSGKIIAYLHKVILRNENLAKAREYYPTYTTVNAPLATGNLTPSQNFDRMRYDFQNTPYGTLSASPNSTITRTGSNLAAVQPIDFSGSYSSPTVSHATGDAGVFDANKSGVFTNDLLTIEETGSGIKIKELSRSKQSMQSLPLTMVNSLNDSEFTSIQYPDSRELVIFQGKMSNSSNSSSIAFCPEKLHPFYGNGILVYAGYRKLATLYLDKETGEVGLALLSW